MKKQVKKSLIIFSSLIGIAAIATTAIVTPIELTHKQSDSSSAAIASNSTTSPATSGIVANNASVKPAASVAPTNANVKSSTTTSNPTLKNSTPTSTATSSTSTNSSNLGPVVVNQTISNQGNAYFAQLDNFLLAKNSFSSSQIDQMNQIIDNTDFLNNDTVGSSLVASTNANSSKVNETMRTLAKDFVANMQTNGLQKNAVQTFLASKNVPTSWVNKNTTINNVSINASSKLVTLLSVLYKLDQNNSSNLISNLNGFINEDLPTYFNINQENGQQLSPIFFTNVVKSVQLVSIANDTYQFSIWTKPNITLENNASSLYHNGQATGTQLTLNVGINKNSETIQTINYSFSNNLNSLIEKAENEQNYGASEGLTKTQLIGALINNAMSSNPSQYLTISVNGYALPSWTYHYFLTATNGITISSINDNVYTMQVSFPTSLSFWKVKDQMIHAGNDCNYVLIDYTYNSKNTNDSTAVKLNLLSEEQILKAEISLYNSQISSTQSNSLSTKRNLAWDEATYVSDNLGSSSSAAQQAMSEWYTLNNAYHSNNVSQFNTDFSTIESYYNADVDPAQTQLSLINDAKEATTKLSSEEDGLAIASTVAAGISMALAAAYWAGTFFFGVTTASAIAATAAAVSCTATTVTMWKEYDDTLTLKSEVGTSYQKTLNSIKTVEYNLGMKNLPGELRSVWSDFKDLFDSKITSILTATKASVGAQTAVVGACGWADEALLALTAVDAALSLAVSVATIALNSVNSNWLNAIYNAVKSNL